VQLRPEDWELAVCFLRFLFDSSGCASFRPVGFIFKAADESLAAKFLMSRLFILKKRFSHPALRE